MSTTLIENQAGVGEVTDVGGLAESRNGSERYANWKWMALVCFFLALSGGVRFWRDHEFAERLSKSKECPIQLSEIPKALGIWRAVEGAETTLDPEVARIAGSTSHIIRTYTDPSGGEKIQVLVLYGPAQEVFGHTPEICYPASGFQAVVPMKDYPITVPDLSTPAMIRTQVFGRTVGPSQVQFEEVQYAFRHANRWQADVARHWKNFRYDPGMFKIQAQRQVSAAAANPSAPKSTVTESFMREMIREIERRVVTASPPPAQ